MQIGPLDLPDEVLTALEEERLVIFAGAGVSIPPPASLPDFRGLVEGIVGRTLCPEEVEQMDRVLGRAKEKGVPVHRNAAEHLAQPESRFNSLHESLVALFGSATAMRIVTTNFDQHFEGAIEKYVESGGSGHLALLEKLQKR
jgi:NAD-dependent SIR2 family protein deacetylase